MHREVDSPLRLEEEEGSEVEVVMSEVGVAVGELLRGTSVERTRDER